MSSIGDVSRAVANRVISPSIPMKFAPSIACSILMFCSAPLLAISPDDTAKIAVPMYSAEISVFPWVPTPQQQVVVTIGDTVDGVIRSTGAVLGSSSWSINGNAIAITAHLEPPPASSPDPITAFSVNLGMLPAGRYTIQYFSDSPDNPAFHNVAMSFSVAENGLATAVEYFNSSLGHYFITADQVEIAKLDQGVTVGWTRTGEAFHVMFGETAPSYGVSVCRFYGLPSAGLNSHFFSASATECNEVQALWPTQWILESTNAFAVVYDPTQGSPKYGVYYDFSGNTGCPAGSQKLYRLYNNRPDANHRYTTLTSIRDAMLALGWILEGAAINTTTLERYAMCVPL